MKRGHSPFHQLFFWSVISTVNIGMGDSYQGAAIAANSSNRARHVIASSKPEQVACPGGRLGLGIMDALAATHVALLGSRWERVQQ